jgi:hypothetical protein
MPRHESIAGVQILHTDLQDAEKIRAEVAAAIGAFPSMRVRLLDDTRQMSYTTSF